jgi:acetyl-CoA C-acetyltransferase
MALEKVFLDSEMTVDDIDLFDLYSCFPIAVFNACHYLGLPIDGTKKLTVTGGLPFFGGAGNNYSLHAIAEVITSLRNSGLRNALVVSNGGYLSKHSVGLYSNKAIASWEARSSESNQRLLDSSERVSVVEKASGLAIIETYAAQHSRSNKTSGFIVGRMISNNERFMAVADSRDEETMRQLFDKQPIGKKINVTHKKAINYFRFVA